MFERGGVDPFQKVLTLVQQPQHKSTSYFSKAPIRNHFGAIFIEFGDTKKSHTFRGLEFVPKRQLAVSVACTKVKNTFKSFGTIRKKFFSFQTTKNARYVRSLGKKRTIREKFVLLKTTKNARYVRSLGKNPHFGAYTEAKRRVTRGQVR